MFKFLLTAITSAVLLIPSSSQAQANNAQLTGTVAYRERVALPPDAVIGVQLLDTSIADVAAQTVAEALINAEGRQVPVPFTLTYDPAKIVPGNRYSVRATIRSGDGMLMFSTTQVYPVLTHGAPSKVNLILHTVGHGAHPGASGKKQPVSAASEGTVSDSQSPTAATAESAPLATATSTEPAPDATTPSARQGEKPAAQAESNAAAPETVAAPPAVSPTESAPTPPTPTESAGAPPASAESPSAETAPTNSASSSRNAPPESTPTPSVPAPPAPTTEPPTTATAAAPEGESSSRESKPAELRATPSESTTPSESKAEPSAPTPDSKAAEPEAPLPEAPSASKRAELAAATPDSANGDEAADSVPARPARNNAQTPLADTQWKLIQLAGQDVFITPPQKPVTLAFSPEGRRIAGSAGCNSYIGTFTDDHGRLHLDPGNMTMMYCADPAGSREKKFVAMLRAANGYKINGDFLLLTSDGKTVAKFKNNQE